MSHLSKMELNLKLLGKGCEFSDMTNAVNVFQRNSSLGYLFKQEFSFTFFLLESTVETNTGGGSDIFSFIQYLY